MSAKKVNSTMLRDALDVFFLVSAEILVFVLLDYFQIVLTLPAMIAVAISTVVFVALCLLLLPDKSEETSLQIAGRDSGSEVSLRSSLSLVSRNSSENTRKTRVSDISSGNIAAHTGSEVSLFLDDDVEQELKRMDLFIFSGYIKEDGNPYSKEEARQQHQGDIKRMKLKIDLPGQDLEARKVSKKSLLISNGSNSPESPLRLNQTEEYSPADNTCLINNRLNNEKLKDYFQDTLSQACITGSALMTYLKILVGHVNCSASNVGAGYSSVNVEQRITIKPLEGDTVDVTIKFFLIRSKQEYEIGSITAELDVAEYSEKGFPLLLKYIHNFSQETFKSKLGSFYHDYQEFDRDFNQAYKEALDAVKKMWLEKYPNQGDAHQILEAIDSGVDSENAFALSHGLYGPRAIVQKSEVDPKNATQASTP